ncbi:MAG: hypothetical protein OXI64_09695 [Defluviicoccus sp.]|nr:hypothetical protein [Defluviicoccus sp.]
MKVFFGPDRPYNAAAAAITKSLIEEWDGEIPDDLKVHMTKEHETAPINAAEVATATGLTSAARAARQDGELDSWEKLDPETLSDSGITVAGTPQQCIESLKLYNRNGVDEVLVLVLV